MIIERVAIIILLIMVVYLWIKLNKAFTIIDKINIGYDDTILVDKFKVEHLKIGDSWIILEDKNKKNNSNVGELIVGNQQSAIIKEITPENSNRVFPRNFGISIAPYGRKLE